MFHDRPNPVEAWPFDQLVTTLLKQFKRPLASYGVALADAEAQVIGKAVSSRDSLPESVQVIRDALVVVIAESEAVLSQHGLTFAQSLKTGMDMLPGWESTADFLALADEKANAEIRIGAGSALLAALGDLRYADNLFDQLENAPDEAEAAIARRVLLFLSGADATTPEGLEQARRWVEQNRL
jgi:hypothetical protein